MSESQLDGDPITHFLQTDAWDLSGVILTFESHELVSLTGDLITLQSYLLSSAVISANVTQSGVTVDGSLLFLGADLFDEFLNSGRFDIREMVGTQDSPDDLLHRLGVHVRLEEAAPRSSIDIALTIGVASGAACALMISATFCLIMIRNQKARTGIAESAIEILRTTLDPDMSARRRDAVLSTALKVLENVTPVDNVLQLRIKTNHNEFAISTDRDTRKARGA